MERVKTNEAALEEMRQLAASSNVCMLITTEANGNRRNRPMGAMQIDDEGNCWFFASKSSGKLKDIYGNNKIQVVFANPDFDDYLEIHGTGIVVCDEEEIVGKWSPLVNQWFPRGAADPEVCLVRIAVTEVFCWDKSADAIRRLRLKVFDVTEHQRLAA